MLLQVVSVGVLAYQGDGVGCAEEVLSAGLPVGCSADVLPHAYVSLIIRAD